MVRVRAEAYEAAALAPQGGKLGGDFDDAAVSLTSSILVVRSSKPVSLVPEYRYSRLLWCFRR